MFFSPAQCPRSNRVRDGIPYLMGKEAVTVTSKKMDFNNSLKFMYLLHYKFNKRSPLYEGKQSLPSKNTSNLSNSLENKKKEKKAGHPIIQKHNGILSNFDKQVAGGVISATVLSQNYHF